MDSMDETVTPAGARLLERFLTSPERDTNEIRRNNLWWRSFLVPSIVRDVREVLRSGSDLERILGRLRNR